MKQWLKREASPGKPCEIPSGFRKHGAVRLEFEFELSHWVGDVLGKVGCQHSWGCDDSKWIYWKAGSIDTYRSSVDRNDYYSCTWRDKLLDYAFSLTIPWIKWEWTGWSFQNINKVQCKQSCQEPDWRPERWLSANESILLLQRIWVQFPVPLSGS